MTEMNTATKAIGEVLRAKTYLEVQDELIEELVHLVPYWIQTNAQGQDDNLTYRLSGMIHSLHAVFSGCSGGFDPSIDMYPFSTEEDVQRLEAEGGNFFASSADTSEDINDGGMKYHRGEEYAPVPDNSNPPRQWTPAEGKALFLNKVADFLHEAIARDELSDMEKGAHMLRSILNLCENGTEDFPKVMLLAVSHPEDKEYYIEQEENYYEEDGTPLTGQERSLLEVWDFYWDRIVRRHAGLPVESLYRG